MRLLEEERIRLDRPQLVGPPPAGTASCGRALELVDRDLGDLAERKLQEALAAASGRAPGLRW